MFRDIKTGRPWEEKMINIPASVMPPPGENWLPPCNPNPSNAAVTRNIPGINTFSILPPPIPQHFPHSIPPHSPGMEPSFYPVQPFSPMVPISPTGVAPHTPVCPMALNTHKIASLKFISDNHLALSKARKRSLSRDRHKNSSSIREREVVRSHSRRSRSRDRSEIRRPSSSTSSRSRSRSKVRGCHRSTSNRRSRSSDRLKGSSKGQSFRVQQRNHDRRRSRTPDRRDRETRPGKRSRSRELKKRPRSPERSRRESPLMSKVLSGRENSPRSNSSRRRESDAGIKSSVKKETSPRDKTSDRIDGFPLAKIASRVESPPASKVIGRRGSPPASNNSSKKECLPSAVKSSSNRDIPSASKICRRESPSKSISLSRLQSKSPRRDKSPLSKSPLRPENSSTNQRPHHRPAGNNTQTVFDLGRERVIGSTDKVASKYLKPRSGVKSRNGFDKPSSARGAFSHKSPRKAVVSRNSKVTLNVSRRRINNNMGRISTQHSALPLRRSKLSNSHSLNKTARNSTNHVSSTESSISKRRYDSSPVDKILLEEKPTEDSDDECIDEWVRSAPAELYYTRGENGDMVATDRTRQICDKFYSRLLQAAKEKRLEAEDLGKVHMAKLVEEEKKEMLQRKCQKSHNKACNENISSTDSDDSLSDDSDSEEISSRGDTSNRELERRKKHPRRLHEELWHNDPGQMNDGPVCRCSAKARRFGIRHGFYPGETPITSCDPYTNNMSKLFHYKILINPATNLIIKSPTVICHDGHEYIFEGFSIFSHYKLNVKLPPCRVIRFNIRYWMGAAEETFPQNFCVRELKLFETYIFREILELVDLNFEQEEDGENSGCSQFHLMPRFARQLPDNGKEILSMDRVLHHLLKSDKELIEENDLRKYLSVEQSVWQDFADKHKGTIVVKRGMKPCAIRVDQIDRNVECQDSPDQDGIPFPLIVHFGIRPPQLSYAGNVEYQRAWRRFVKYRHLLSNMPKPKIEDKRKLLEKDLKLQEMRTRSTMKRDVTVDISSKGFRTTGICCDLVQHAMLIPVLFAHMRFHKALGELEKQMNYAFKNRYLLQLAMTHPSYRENFGTNPDHARNALTNCGIRQPEYGDRSIHYASSRKRGINTLIDIMARFGMKENTESGITHNERLEFLGDAVVEFVTSIHLFHIFPDLEEGGLATYRAAIVQNQHLAVLAQNLGLDRFMLYAHGSDLCHDSELRHAMANCFEALMGALFLDGAAEVWSQIKVADKVFARTMYGKEKDVYDIWVNYPKHPLQAEEPNGDRHWIESHVALQKITKFEEDAGIEFNHIRLLARAFTDRSLGYNNLTRGSNQRLEFLGDTVLQLIASEYLYRHFPDHHEGHLSLLRSSLVNNRTQAIVCDTLGMSQYAMRHDPKSEMKTKDRADLLEAFLGALYIDQDLHSCVVFCSVCFFPRLTDSIINQDWNDPKSKLQQCCLTLRSMDGKEPEIPSYKVTEVMGPTNTRVYKVAVYFRNKRLATSRGHSIQEAEMNAAANALIKRDYLFPQLKHQKRLLEKTTKNIVVKLPSVSYLENHSAK